MSECDIFYVSGVTCWEDVSAEGVLITRLLVGQCVGARSSGVAAKTRKLLHQLQLDSRSCSILMIFSNDFIQF